MGRTPYGIRLNGLRANDPSGLFGNNDLWTFSFEPNNSDWSNLAEQQSGDIGAKLVIGDLGGGRSEYTFSARFSEGKSSTAEVAATTMTTIIQTPDFGILNSNGTRMWSIFPRPILLTFLTSTVCSRKSLI